MRPGGAHVLGHPIDRIHSCKEWDDWLEFAELLNTIIQAAELQVTWLDWLFLAQLVVFEGFAEELLETVSLGRIGVISLKS